jgi:hypothetical protein
MKRITVVIDDNTEQKFNKILETIGDRRKWKKMPTKKSLMCSAIDLLYKREVEGYDFV